MFGSHDNCIAPASVAGALQVLPPSEDDTAANLQLTVGRRTRRLRIEVIRQRQMR